MKTLTLNCRSCGAPLPEDSDPRRKYCPGTRCRQNFNEQLNRERKATQTRTMRTARDSHNRNVPEIKEMKARALDVLEDEIRDTMREVIKEEITPVIREKAQGAVLVMLDMLPKAMAALSNDLDSKDAVARRSATAIVMKYAMPTVQENTKVEEDRTHTVYHWIPSPEGTAMGDAMMDATRAYHPQENYEAFEEDWIQCFRCEQRTPPENITHPHGKDREPYCTSCNIRWRIENGDMSADSFLNPIGPDGDLHG